MEISIDEKIIYSLKYHLLSNYSRYLFWCSRQGLIFH